jgi:hypothetical protein
MRSARWLSAPKRAIASVRGTTAFAQARWASEPYRRSARSSTAGTDSRRFSRDWSSNEVVFAWACHDRK